MYKIRELSKIANEKFTENMRKLDIVSDVFNRLDSAETEILEGTLKKSPFNFSQEPPMDDNAYNFVFLFQKLKTIPSYWVETNYFYYILRENEIEVISKYEYIDVLINEFYKKIEFSSKTIQITPEEYEILCKLKAKDTFKGKVLYFDGINRSDSYYDARGCTCWGITPTRLKRKLEVLLKPFVENKPYIAQSSEIEEDNNTMTVTVSFYFEGSNEGMERVIQKESEDIYYKLLYSNFSPSVLEAIRRVNFAKMVESFLCHYAQDYIDGKENASSEIVEKKYLTLVFKFDANNSPICVQYKEPQIICSYPRIYVSLKLEDISYTDNYNCVSITPSPSLVFDVSDTFRKNPTLYYICNVFRPILTRSRYILENDIYNIISEQIHTVYNIKDHYSSFFRKNGEPEENICTIKIVNPFYNGTL